MSAVVAAAAWVLAPSLVVVALVLWLGWVLDGVDAQSDVDAERE